MKGIILASLVSAAYAAAVVIIFRAHRPENRAGVMFKLYLATLPVLGLLLAATPADLGMLPLSLTEPNTALEGAYSIFVYSASVLGGWLQLYNLADRGLSLRILIDAREHPRHTVDAGYIRRAYGGGKGIDWMYQKRLADLLRLGLVSIDESKNVALTEKGLRNARLVRFLRRLFVIGPGGKLP